MNRRILAFVLVSIVLSLPEILQAQNNFREGYIVTNSNDTLQGAIRLPSKFAKNATFSFLKDGSKKAEMLSPQHIQAIRTNEQYFVSKKVSYKGKEEIVFLEVLSTGAVNTYYLDKENYYIEKGAEIYHLTNAERKDTNDDGSTYSVNSRKYMGLLAYAFQDEPSLKPKIRNTSFTSKSLVRLSEEYSKLACPYCPFTDYTRNTKTMIYLEPQAGVSYTSLSFKSSSDHATHISPTAGIDVRFVSSKNPSWSFITGIHYSSIKLEDYFTNTIFGPKETDHVMLDYSTYSVPLIVEHSWSVHKWQPFARLGYNNIFVNYRDYFIKMLVPYSTYEIDKNDFFSQDNFFKNYQIGLLAGVGIKYQISHQSFLFLNGNFGFRIPSVNAHYFLEKQQTSAVDVSVGYSFRIK